MGQENTSTTDVGFDVAAKTAGTDTITADTYRHMLDVLESLANHNHIFYDDYTTVCECQCQCQCSRGTF